MASYRRPFPPPSSSAPPSSNFAAPQPSNFAAPPPSNFSAPPPPTFASLPPPPNSLPPYSQHHHYNPHSNFAYAAPSHHYNPQTHHHQQPQPPPPQQNYIPPPPPPSSWQPQQNPPPPQYFPSSQYSSHHAPLPPPPSHSLPPPPPPSGLPPAPPSHPAPSSSRRDHAPSVPPAHRESAPVAPPGKPSTSLPPKSKPPTAPGKLPAGKPAETEEERKLRKRREYEKAKEDEKRKMAMKEMVKKSQASVLQKTQQMSAGARPHGSLTGSRVAERRATQFLSGDRVENRLKKPTTFLCKLKFRNELPDPTAQPKLIALNTDKDRYTRYAFTSLEKTHKPKLYPEQDLGIPLDLLDLSVYKVPDVCPPLDPEDEELLRDDEEATPVKKEGGIKRKDRPTDKGVSWLVKTQYISPLSMESAKLSLTEKQAKEMRANKEGRNLFMENLNNRERQIQAIEESFKSAKLVPVHQTKPKLKPEKVIPLLPDFDRCLILCLCIVVRLNCQGLPRRI